MMYGDYHVHTNHCDGKSTALEIVSRAVELGLSEIGFSGHIYTPHDVSYCMQENPSGYLRDIELAREHFGDKISILVGVEQDFFGAAAPYAGYRIGSVHYVEVKGELVAVDESPEILKAVAQKHFGGDMLMLCELYFKTLAEMAKKIKPDIIGHFDLVRKFNEKENLFDEKSERYIRAWQESLSEIISLGIPFEINTGAISRGYASFPYPSAEQIKYIAERGGRFVMSSDCHDAKNLCFEFSKWREWAENMGAVILTKIEPQKI